MRKIKRTAAQRRYLAFKRKATAARCRLEYLQSLMQGADKEGKQMRPLYIMQQITEAIGFLSSE